MHKNNICLCLTGTTFTQNLESVFKYKRCIDLVELRADFLDKNEWKHLSKIPGMLRLPVILTMRRKKEGGHFVGPENLRRRILKNALEGGFSFIDLEEDNRDTNLEKEARRMGTRIIRSLHSFDDFSDAARGLNQRIRRMIHDPSDLPKAALMIRSTGQLNTLLGLAKDLADIPKILIGMGSIGFPTRVLAGRLGSYLTYTSGKEAQAAEGHTDPSTLCDIYRYNNIAGTTKIFGVIGNPIMHSFSPLIHNEGYASLGLDAVYLPFQVDSIADFFVLAETLDIRGVSVTIPHKESVIPFLAQADTTVKATGSCNTMARLEGNEQGEHSKHRGSTNGGRLAETAQGWFGINTDVEGFLAPLRRKHTEMFRKPGSTRTTVIGAGGSARSIVYALRKEGMQVLIVNRTVERAKSLAEEFGCEWKALSNSERVGDYSDLIVQATSVGMQPDTSGDPLPGYQFKGHEIVYDIVYNPALTVFLSRAKKKGCSTVFGKEMLISQALMQFKLFTGFELPEPEKIKLDF